MEEGSDLSNTILSPVLEKSLTIAAHPRRPRDPPTLVPFDKAILDACAHERGPIKPLVSKGRNKSLTYFATIIAPLSVRGGAVPAGEEFLEF
jgi:hypothetical protein